jgi:ribonuclease R
LHNNNQKIYHQKRDNADIKSIRDAIVAVVNKENGRPISRKMLFFKLTTDHRDIGYIDNFDYINAIKQLKDDGVIFILQSDDIVLQCAKNTNRRPPVQKVDVATLDPTKALIGTVNINAAGTGFVTLKNDKEAKYIVNRINLNNAQNGDEVEFFPVPTPNDMRLINAVIKTVLNHAKDYYVGEFILNSDKTYQVKVDDEKFTLQVILDQIDGLVNGHKILFQIGKYELDKCYATVTKIIGHKSDVGTDILSVVFDNGVEPDFPQSVLEATQKMKFTIDDEQRRIRKDLSNQPIITIDPATSKDFDDAFYCKKINDQSYFLSVSIADVSHYVKFDSELDVEALRRGCSIYLVDRVIPMLPHNLSDDICSIVPNEQRFALTCEMMIDAKGNFTDIKVFPSIIKS